MCPISFKLHRFPPEVIRQAVWLYFRFVRRLMGWTPPDGIYVPR